MFLLLQYVSNIKSINFQDQGLNRLAPKLTEIHINPGPFQKMKVKYASQIFSNTVAAGMKCCVQGGTLPSTANATITFIEHMDKLFDLLNSKKKKYLEVKILIDLLKTQQARGNIYYICA